jgi:hypothetical protein
VIDMSLIFWGRNTFPMPYWPDQRFSSSIISKPAAVPVFVFRKNFLLLSLGKVLSRTDAWMVF